MKATRDEKLERTDWRVYVIVDPRRLPVGRDLFECAQLALRGGAGAIQLRNKQAGARTLIEQSKALQELCDGFDALFIVNDRLDVALAAGADGVHLGPDDIPVNCAREIAPDLVIGASAGSVELASRLVDEGADYLGVGAIFDAHVSKPNASMPRGPQILATLTDRFELPVIGIGGITAANAAQITAQGAAGVAVIRAVVSSDTPEAATRALRAAVDSGRPRD
jgi:thiamine-phosphate pyrophosphorylase